MGNVYCCSRPQDIGYVCVDCRKTMRAPSSKQEDSTSDERNGPLPAPVKPDTNPIRKEDPKPAP